MASGGSFRFRVLVGMSRVPLHARNTPTAQAILGPTYAEVDIVRPNDIPEDDGREFFITAWCLHPRFIPEEVVIFIPEPRIANPIEASLEELPRLHYLVRLCLVAYQDWNTPLASPTTNNDDGDDQGNGGGSGGDHHAASGHDGELTLEEDISARRDYDDEDSVDSNFNRYHPGLDRAGGATPPPSGEAGRGACSLPSTPEPGNAIVMGGVLCPLQQARGLVASVTWVPSRRGRMSTRAWPWTLTFVKGSHAHPLLSCSLHATQCFARLRCTHQQGSQPHGRP